MTSVLRLHLRKGAVDAGCRLDVGDRSPPVATAAPLVDVSRHGAYTFETRYMYVYTSHLHGERSLYCCTSHHPAICIIHPPAKRDQRHANPTMAFVFIAAGIAIADKLERRREKKRAKRLDDERRYSVLRDETVDRLARTASGGVVATIPATEDALNGVGEGAGGEDPGPPKYEDVVRSDGGGGGTRRNDWRVEDDDYHVRHVPRRGTGTLGGS